MYLKQLKETQTKLRILSITMIMALLVITCGKYTLDCENALKSAKIDELESIINRQRSTIEQLESSKTLKQYIARATSYYIGDSTGSGTWVGAGLETKDFQVNNKGFYTYQDKVVIATATHECIASKALGCGEYNEYKDYLEYYSYYDEIEIVVEGITYPAIVLDSCGACSWDNRIDIFVADREYVYDGEIKVIREVE